MKIIAIGDIHGKDVWKKIIHKEIDADKIVFIGDYFDSFDIPFQKQANNFNEILNFKMNNPGKVVLLIGNHDFHYLTISGNDRYSGYQNEFADDIRDVLEAAIDCNYMQMAFQHERFLFTHAGVTKTWFESFWNHNGTAAERINTAFFHDPEKFKFTPSNPLDNTGESITQPPIWVRPAALLRDLLPVNIQIVGHTKHKNINVQKAFGLPKSTEKVFFIDVLDFKNEYLSIVDGEIDIKTI